MKIKYSLFIVALTLILSANAQVNKPTTRTAIKSPYPLAKTIITNKTINCVDSVRYPQSKLSGVAETGPLTNNTAKQTGISQAYHYSSSGLIHGIGAYLLLDFDGIAGNFSPITAKIKIYNIDAQNYPTTPIDSTIVQVLDVGFDEQVLMFSAPIAVSDSFAIAIEMGTFNATTDTIWYTTNICGWTTFCSVGDGNNENLSCVLSPDFNSANNSHWFNNNLEVFGWNIDFLMHPIISHDIISSYTTDKDSIYPNDTVVFTNTSAHVTDVMFNLYNTTTNPLYTWNFDDGSGTYNPFDTSYVFTAQGTYNTQLTANYYGYSLNCMDASAKPIVVKFPLTIEEKKSIKDVSIYPIPANKYFNMNVPTNYFGGEIILTDVVGKTLKKVNIETQDKVKITTDGISAGIYFVSIDSNGERVFTKRIVIDK